MAIDGDVSGKKIAVLGAAFKPDSDDIRDSPALDIAGTLQEMGADVRVHDPKALDNARRTRPGPTYCDDLREAVAGAEVVLHLTEWREYRELDPIEIGGLVASRKLLEGRNALDVDRWVAAGWAVKALGRPRVGG